MRKYPLIGVSICAVVILVLASLSNVVGNESTESCGCDPPCWPELSGKMGENNWYISTVKVTFNGTLNEIYYRINGSNWIVYSIPFTLNSQGSNLLEWACDSNLSDIYSTEIKIDTSPPWIPDSSYKKIGLFKWQISVNATDDISGVNRVLFYDNGYIDTEPPYQIIWQGFMRLRIIWDFLYQFIFGIILIPFDVWDNAGNSLVKPS